MGTTEDETGRRWDAWPKVVLSLVIYVLGGAFILNAWLGYSVAEAVFFMGFVLVWLLALALWRRRSKR